ncbi:Hypp4329 [Branchiostoma lanceolatum]|uniref:Hypp4329 protein n=1 Tax=Branchiostoma lanceolatum TaxID=7740 RepID=A0A8K0AAH9_BRALA|nr:Hypp4329 [Branchiostoma lanceolatum]
MPCGKCKKLPESCRPSRPTWRIPRIGTVLSWAVLAAYCGYLLYLQYLVLKEHKNVQVTLGEVVGAAVVRGVTLLETRPFWVWIYGIPTLLLAAYVVWLQGRYLPQVFFTVQIIVYVVINVEIWLHDFPQAPTETTCLCRDAVSEGLFLPAGGTMNIATPYVCTCRYAGENAALGQVATFRPECLGNELRSVHGKGVEDQLIVKVLNSTGGVEETVRLENCTMALKNQSEEIVLEKNSTDPHNVVRRALSCTGGGNCSTTTDSVLGAHSTDSTTPAASNTSPGVTTPLVTSQRTAGKLATVESSSVTYSDSTTLANISVTVTPTIACQKGTNSSEACEAPLSAFDETTTEALSNHTEMLRKMFLFIQMSAAVLVVARFLDFDYKAENRRVQVSKLKQHIEVCKLWLTEGLDATNLISEIVEKATFFVDWPTLTRITYVFVCYSFVVVVFDVRGSSGKDRNPSEQDREKPESARKQSEKSRWYTEVFVVISNVFLLGVRLIIAVQYGNDSEGSTVQKALSLLFNVTKLSSTFYLFMAKEGIIIIMGIILLVYRGYVKARETDIKGQVYQLQKYARPNRLSSKPESSVSNVSETVASSESGISNDGFSTDTEIAEQVVG